MKFLTFLFLIMALDATAVCTQPSYCNRSCWDPNGTHPPQSNPTSTSVTHIIVHHTGDGFVLPIGTNYPQQVRAYWDLHVNTNGWSDIGYNWLIDRNGVIYEGRGDGILGAHFSGMNSGTMGVALIGDFTLETPSIAALNSLKNLLAWEATDKNIDVTASSYHAASLMVLNNISGHQDGSATACPGTSLYSQLPSIRNDISNYPCYNGTGGSLNCSNAVQLSCDVTYSAGSSSAPSNVSTYGCNNWTETGPERVHTITPSGSGTITATISNYTGDLDVYILGSCDPMNCLGSVASSSATYSNAQAGQTYYIVVDSDDGSGSGYDLVVTCPPVQGEDIFITNESVSPSVGYPGDVITVNLDANYSGFQTTSTLPTFDLEYYFGSSCDLNSATYFDNDTYGIGTNDPFDSESTSYTIPTGTAPGQYYILVFVDSDNELNETNESNNLVCLPVMVLGTLNENIWLSNVNVSPATANPGDIINVSADCNYMGSQTTSNLPTFDLEYYISSSCNLNSATLLDTDQFSVGSNNTMENESASLQIPTWFTPGNYYILFFADSEYELQETDETDNIVCIPITIQGITLDDLVLSNGTISNSVVLPGDYVYVTVDHEYIGTQLSANLPDIRLDLYLSDDCDPNGFDSLLQTTYSDLGTDNSVENESMYVEIPQNTPPGLMRLILFSDANGQLPELDDFNNNIFCLDVLVENTNSLNSPVLSSDITLYPNPATEEVKYNSGGLTIKEVFLLDMQGRILKVTKGESGVITLENLATGRYFVRFILDDHTPIVKELIKL